MKYLAEPFVHCAAVVFVFVVGISDLRQDPIVLFMYGLGIMSFSWCF